MLPKIAAYARACQEDARDVCRRLDEWLFEPGIFFALDATNRRVAGVPVASLGQGHDLIAQGGAVASIVGRLRADFAAVDVDVAGVPGEAITEAIASWCDRVGVWHVVRPSGGAPGRHHVIIHAATRRDALEGLIAQLRASWQASATMIDLRSSVRPLSAPHRLGGWAAPYRPDEALTRLARLGESIGLTHGVAGTEASHTGSAQGKKKRAWTPATPRTPRRTYARRALPGAWQTYLTTGRKPAWSKAHSPTTDTSRSTYELMCTAAMVRAGMSHEEAWHAIETAHPDAMTRSRASWPRWVRAVWNVAVKSDDGFAPVPRVEEPILHATQEARDRLRSLAWTLEMRERVSVLAVATVLLHRMEREGTLRVPCPERDLVLDTGIRSRTTIRAALRRLHGVFGTLHTDSYDITQRATSSFEFEIPVASGVVRDIAPPSFHIPLAPTLPGDLPSAAWLVLASLDSRVGLSAEDVALKAQLCPASGEVSGWARRQVLRHLAHLQGHGLAEVSASGEWTRPQTLPTRDDFSTEQQVVRERIALERLVFRERASAWVLARRASIAACQERAQRWWAGLDAGERALRVQRLSGEFSGLSVWRQQQRKRAWEERNLRRGVDPAQRHAAWLHAQDRREFERRREERRVWFANLADPLRQAYATSWDDHRRRYGYATSVDASSELR